MTPAMKPDPLQSSTRTGCTMAPFATPKVVPAAVVAV